MGQDLHTELGRVSTQLRQTTDPEVRERLATELTNLAGRIARGSTRKGEFDCTDDPMSGTRSFREYLAEPARTDEAREVALFNDDMVTLGALPFCKDGNPRSTREWQRRLDRSPWLKKTMGTGDAAQWIPSEISAEFMAQARLQTLVLSQFRAIDMPSSTFRLPLQGDPPRPRLVAERDGANDDLDANKRVPASDLGLGAVATLVAKKIGIRCVPSIELATEDAIVPLLPYIREEMTTGVAWGLEDAVINGKRTVGGWDADLTDADDVRHFFNGLRFQAVDAAFGNGVAVFAPATAGRIEIGDLLKLKSLMGRHALDPAGCFFCTNAMGINQLMATTDANGNPVVVTLDKFGPAASILTGSIGKIFGVDVIPSQFVRQDLDAFGAYSGITTSYSEVLLVSRRSFVWGNRRPVTLKARESIETDQVSLVMMLRGDFVGTRPVPTSAGVPVGYLYGVRNAS